MVQAARRALKWLAAALGLALAGFLLAAWVGSSIARNPDWREPAADDPDAVEIMVETNGVHTALVLPLLTREKDWRAVFPAGDVAAPHEPYSHVSVSWGEREVFLNTPTWWDLRPKTVMRIVFGGGDGLLHIAHYVRPALGENIRPLRLTRAQYAVLVRRIEAMLPPVPLSEPRSRYPGYGDYDVFYPARGTYTSRNTCNQWTSDTLAAAGVRTGWWTPFAGGVMKWVPDLRK
ncbi:MAG: DUF2459 domain-containing protein [Novosphingobium sp.]|nr:DUF2459 domain-containing protein [Novosphingobium sp.]